MSEEDLQKALAVQHEALRTIQRHFLLPLQQDVDLAGKEHPTLATMTRFHRLRRLTGLLAEGAECGDQLKDWMQNHKASAPAGIVQVVESCVPQVLQASKTLADNWVSAKVVLDAAYCARHVKAMEFKITQFHMHLEELIKIYVTIDTKVLGHPERKKLKKMPIDLKKLDNIEISMPVKYATHSAKAGQP